MIRARYKNENSSFGAVKRPVIEVLLENNGEYVKIPMYIDSGADISMIPYRFGKAIGFKQEKEDIISEIQGISGATVSYIVKRVNIKLNNKNLSVRIAWAMLEEVPILMGRMDIFDKFRIIFDEKAGLIDFEDK